MSHESAHTFKVSVQGEAEVSHQAERALLNVTVTSSGPDKATVSDEVITTAQNIQTLLRSLSPQNETGETRTTAAVAHWSKTSLSATSHVPYDAKTKAEGPRSYKAHVSFDVRFQDFEALGPFSTELTVLPHVQINSLQWALRRETEKSYHSRLRREASLDAVAKAQDYCRVLGCINLRPVELHEGGGPSTRPVYVKRLLHAEGSGSFGSSVGHASGGGEQLSQDESELDFEAQEVKMKHRVDVVFVADPTSVPAPGSSTGE